MEVNPDGTPSFEFSAGERSRDIDRTIEDLVGLPGRIAASRKRRVALVLGEFQQVVAIDPHLPALMRAVFQLQDEVAHVFLGSKRHLMQRVFTDENEPMYKLAKPLPLRQIPAADFAVFIHDRFTHSGQRITEEAAQRILAITDCHPHDTQELCYFTWSLARAENTEVMPDLVDRALDRVLEAEDAHYTEVWGRLTARQRLVLTALATAGGHGVYSEEYRRQHRLGAASSVQRSMEGLVEKELVEAPPPGAYRVADVFLRAWITRVASPRSESGQPPRGA